MDTGIVKTYNESKGFGFITPTAGGRDLHVLGSALRAGSPSPLIQGARVEYTANEGPKGPRATDVCILGGHAAGVTQANVPATTPATTPPKDAKSGVAATKSFSSSKGAGPGKL